MQKQTTILNEISFFGKPKNMEKVVNVKMLPADSDVGIIFKRIDLSNDNIIEVNYNNVYLDNDELILKNEQGVSVKGIEQIISSLWAMRIDNIVVELDGDALPYIDGNCESILFLLTVSHTKELDKERKIFELKNDIFVKLNDCEISIKKSSNLLIAINNKNSKYVFDNAILPFKDELSKLNKETDLQEKYDVISTITLMFISNLYCKVSIEINNFNKLAVLDVFKNLFLNK